MAEKNIGGLWLKTAKTGTKYMSGSIEIEGKKHNFTVFKNKHKNSEKHPDYVILPQTEYKKPEHPAVQDIKDLFEGEDVPDQEIPF